MNFFLWLLLLGVSPPVWPIRPSLNIVINTIITYIWPQKQTNPRQNCRNSTKILALPMHYPRPLPTCCTAPCNPWVYNKVPEVLIHNIWHFVKYQVQQTAHGPGGKVPLSLKSRPVAGQQSHFPVNKSDEPDSYETPRPKKTSNIFNSSITNAAFPLDGTVWRLEVPGPSRY